MRRRKMTLLQRDLLLWLQELKEYEKEDIKTGDVISRLESIIWEEVKIHDTPTGKETSK